MATATAPPAQRAGPPAPREMVTIRAAAREIASRLTSLFMRNADGKRPFLGDNQKLQTDPHFADLIQFNEYFDGETGRHGGAGVGLEDRSADAGKKEAGIVGDGEVVGEAWTSAARETRRSPKLAGGPSRAPRPADAPAHGGCRRSPHAAGASSPLSSAALRRTGCSRDSSACSLACGAKT